MGVRADRPAELSDPNSLLRLGQPLFRPPEFVKHQGELQSKSDRLGVNAVASPDHWSHFEALRLGCDRCSQSGQPLSQDSARLRELNGEGGVEHV